MTHTLQPGTRATWEVPMGRVSFGVTRMQYRSQAVTVLGTVTYEPSMLRVRCADGVARRAFIEHLRAA